jgi:endo-alpha-1,4-polygalactosaminidase (GH114 family)
MINIPVSIGELFDKITILQIKKEKIKSVEKLKNVNKELKLLLQIVGQINKKEIEEEYNQLKNINEMLWNVEDLIREKEKSGCFDNSFIELARSVYIHNDQRAVIKKKINIITNSALVEEKEY